MGSPRILRTLYMTILFCIAVISISYRSSQFQIRIVPDTDGEPQYGTNLSYAAVKSVKTEKSEKWGESGKSDLPPTISNAPNQTLHPRISPNNREHPQLLQQQPTISQVLNQFPTSLPNSNHPNNPSNSNNPNINDGPYLVVCFKAEDPLLPLFSNFTILRLLSPNTTLPPWNATVFLHSEHELCEDHPYLLEAIRRRNRSPYLVSPNITSLTSNEDGIWDHGVHWPNFSNSKTHGTKYLRLIHNRPAIIHIRGEVFWRERYKYSSCADADFLVYREVETPGRDCLTVHYLQGVATVATRNAPWYKGNRGEDLEFGLENTTEMFENRRENPNKPREGLGVDIVDGVDGGGISLGERKFCSMIVRYNSTHPVYMFQKTNYDIDAIVRHIFFRQLGEYKPCERVTECPGNPSTSYRCMVGYKFHITMENSMVDGYLSEKLFNGAIAGGIPIYFGAPDVGKYVNPRSFVHCRVSREVMEEMRSFYPRLVKVRKFLFPRSSNSTDSTNNLNPSNSSNAMNAFNSSNATHSFWPTNEELLTWADGYLRPQLAPCVQRVIELDANDTAYMEVVREPFIVHHEVMSGEYPMAGVMRAYNVLRNWEGSGSFVKVEKVEGSGGGIGGNGRNGKKDRKQPLQNLKSDGGIWKSEFPKKALQSQRTVVKSNEIKPLESSCFRARNDTLSPNKYGKLQTPIINLGFPKMGTTTLHNYFRCGGYVSKHFTCQAATYLNPGVKCAKCIKTSIQNNSPPLTDCGLSHVFAQIDKYDFFPQIEYLEELVSAYPNATFLLMFRPMKKWYNSLRHWPPEKNVLHLDDIYLMSNIQGLPMGKKSSVEVFREWFCWHVTRVRELFAKNTSLNLVEIDIEDDGVGKRMEDMFGVGKECWGHANVNENIHPELSASDGLDGSTSTPS